MPRGRAVTSRWVAAGGISLLVHLLAAGTVGVDLWRPPELPRFEVHEVAGVEVPAEPEATERPQTSAPPPSDPALPPALPPSVPPEPPPPTPEPERPSGTTLAEPAPDVDEVEELAARNVEPALQPPPEPPADGGPHAAPSPDGGPPPPPALALPEGAEEGDMAPLLAGEARVALLVRTELLADSAEAHSLRRTMRMVPGFREYFGQSGVDPLTDFRWMTLRTPDPTRVDLSAVTASLAVDLERARAMVDRVPGVAGRVEWSPLPDGGPPLGTFAASADGGPTELHADVAWAIMDPGDLLLAGPRTWVSHAATRPAEEAVASATAGLEEVRLGDGAPPSLVIAADELRRLVSVRGRSLPLPDSLVMAASFDEESFIVAHLHFSRPAEAERFVDEVQRSLSSWGAHPIARLLDLPDLWRHLQLDRRGARVVASARLGRSEVRRVLALTRWFLAAGEEGGSASAGDVDGRRSRP